MASTTHNPSVLLKRILSLKELSPLVLCIDSLAQTAGVLMEEFAHNLADNTTVVYVSFETINRPPFAAQFIEADQIPLKRLLSTLQSYLPPPTETNTLKRYMVIIDCINYIPNDQLSSFVTSVASPNTTLFAVFHRSQPEFRPQELQHYPSSLQLLQFMATTIFELQPVLPKNIDEEELDYELKRFCLLRGLNSSIFQVKLTNRRRSGRSLSYCFQIDSKTHAYEVVTKAKEDQNGTVEDPEMLEGLTTFNLSTSSRQKAAREQVELPFLDAQSFNTGGAIVYEFEKDDDYDEEDPYEDPF